MRAVKSKGSKIERKLSSALFKLGYRYRRNLKGLPGTPDIVFTKKKIAIFCDSEFWHGYNWEVRKSDLKSNRDFWINKIETNMARDVRQTKELEEMGYTVLRFWGKEIMKNTQGCVDRVVAAIEEQRET